jgi:hypothetical protein
MISRISFVLLIIAGLSLTAYFGAEAWLSGEGSAAPLTEKLPAE